MIVKGQGRLGENLEIFGGKVTYSWKVVLV